MTTQLLVISILEDILLNFNLRYEKTYKFREEIFTYIELLYAY